MVFFKGAANQDPRPEIPSHVWEYPKYRVIPETSGLPEILGIPRHGHEPAT